VIHADEIWEILEYRAPKGQWVELTEIYQIIQEEGKLSEDDWFPSAPENTQPKWKRNVRNVLQKQKRDGKVKWKMTGLYMF